MINLYHNMLKHCFYEHDKYGRRKMETCAKTGIVLWLDLLLRRRKMCLENRYKYFWKSSPFLLIAVVVLASSSVNVVLQEVGLSEEYSLMVISGDGDSKLADIGKFPAGSPPSWWCGVVGRWGYHDVGLRGGQQPSRIDWCRWWWLLLSKRNLS